MKLSNIEIKKNCSDLSKIREKLIEINAYYIGEDVQTDTYFKTIKGLLKFRESSLLFENGLIHYQREKKASPKYSQITVYKPSQEKLIKQILTDNLEVIAVIKKRREIYIIDNVKFHLDSVENLGDFFEIEAQDTHGLLEKSILLKQCRFYMNLLDIKRKDLIKKSYFDLLHKKTNKSV